jgi:tagaturonate reductase
MAMPILSNQSLSDSNFKPKVKLVCPNPEINHYPEKVLQFGTGVLLRGLCDYFIDKANQKAIFKGRVVLVKSTSKGDSNAFEQQDNLYTHCVKGIEEGKEVEEYLVNSSISRTLVANTEWDQILACAQNPDMQIVISNTTEVGIQYLANDVLFGQTPKSFPAKLLAFLHARYEHFKGAESAGMVIIPTELIINNGVVLAFLIVINLLNYVEELEEIFILGLGFFLTGVSGMVVCLTFVRFYYDLRYGKELEDKILEEREK